jgi:hypothetical protein
LLRRLRRRGLPGGGLPGSGLPGSGLPGGGLRGGGLRATASELARARRLAAVIRSVQPPRRAAFRRAAPGSGRAAGAALIAALVAAGTASCSGFDKAFGQREAVVVFKPGTPDATRLAVRAACADLPRATPEPLPTDGKASDYLNNVRFRIDKATDEQVVQLENCLRRFGSVTGVDIPQDSNS